MTLPMRRIALSLLLSAVALAAAPALAQPSRTGPDPVGAAGPEDTEKVKQVFVYGDDPCPPSVGDEIVVCARLPDNDRYRIPEGLRTDPNSNAVQAWTNRARAIETVGATGINSCSPAGAGGWTGCFAKLAREMKEERKAMLGGANWAEAVKAEREKRLANLDAESEAVEQQAREEEALAATRARAEEAARARLATEERKPKP
jgi:hypothetical protein